MPRTLADITVGDIVKLNMNGVLTDYIVVQQGNPDSSEYDSSYNGGTWLMMKNVWSEDASIISFSTTHTFYQTTTFTDILDNIYNALDSDIQSAIQQVTRHAYEYDAGDMEWYGGSYSRKIFALTYIEVGATRTVEESSSHMDGAPYTKCLAYFVNLDQNAASVRVATDDIGAYASYWLESKGYVTRADYFTACDTTGAVRLCDVTVSREIEPIYIRPVFILPSTTYVLDDDTVTTNLPPSAPSSIYVPQVTAGSQCVITWGAATDPDGTIVSYQLERSVNGSGWSQIFSGNALTYTDTVGEDWGTMAYRVCAVDNNNKSGPYTTSSTITVANGVMYITGPSDNMGELIAPTTVQFSVGVTGDTVQDVSLTIKVDGSVEYDGLVDSAEQVTIDIDTRLLSGGTHVITAVATKQNYIQANGSYIFTTMSIAVPDGGYLEQASNASNTPIFFRTIAAAVAGLSIPMTRDVVLNVTGWVQSSGRYYQTVTVETVQENTAIVLTDCILSDDLDANSAIIEAWGTVMQYAPVQGNGTLTFYATNVPTVNIPVCVGVL